LGRRRRRRKIRLRPKRKLPEIFQCPICGMTTVSVAINKKEGIAVVKCAKCNASKTFPYNPYYHPVDYYSKFLDAIEAEMGEAA